MLLADEHEHGGCSIVGLTDRTLGCVNRSATRISSEEEVVTGMKVTGFENLRAGSGLYVDFVLWRK